MPFDPAKLTGLSEKLMRSHWVNNYIGPVRALNMIAERAQPDGSGSALLPHIVANPHCLTLGLLAVGRGEATVPYPSSLRMVPMPREMAMLAPDGADRST